MRFAVWPGIIPKGRVYFFSHHTLIAPRVLRWVLPAEAKKLVLFTHYRARQNVDRLIPRLNSCHHIFAMNSMLAGQLICDGLDTKRVSIELGFADPRKFYVEAAIDRSYIGFVANYLPDAHYGARKNYELLFKLALHLSISNNVLLIGKGFRSSEFAPLLTKSTSLKYVEAKYSDFRTHYNQMKVFVSVSRLEGGPIALLEAMMCGCIPVATNTGFSSDLIEHQKNGLIIQDQSNFEQIVTLIDRAMLMENPDNISNSVTHHSFQHFANRLIEEGLSV